MKISYDLATEAWIPVRMADGSRASVGLIDAIVRAHEIASLDMMVPLEEIGVFRVLMAIAYRVVDGPRTPPKRKENYERGRFPEDKAKAYFAKYSDRFDLFDEKHPFLQTPGLSVLDKDGKDSPLLAELLCFECINNKTLFEHHGVKNPRKLAPEEAARKLVAFQYYAYSGLAKKTVNLESIGYQPNFFYAPLVSGIATILVGPTLFDTLCLNMIVVNEGQPIAEIDHSQNTLPWEREERLLTNKTAVPFGYFDYLVPISRHVRLIPENIEGHIVVKSLHLSQGLVYPMGFEPMYSYRQDNKDPARFYPAGLSADRALWRESSALFAFSDGQNGDRRCGAFREFAPLREIYRKRSGTSVVRCASYGITDVNFNPILWRKESLSFPQELLESPLLVDGVVTGIKKAANISSELRGACRMFARIALGKDPAPEDVSKLVESLGVLPAYWAELELPFKEFLSHIDEVGSELIWNESMKNAALEAFGRCVDARDIASVTRYKAIVEAERYLHAKLRAELGQEKEEAVDEH